MLLIEPLVVQEHILDSFLNDSIVVLAIPAHFSALTSRFTTQFFIVVALRKSAIPKQAVPSYFI